MLRPDRIVRRAIHHRYVITTTSDETFAGVLMDADARTLVFADVQQIRADGARQSLAGQLVLDRSTVKYLQTTS